MKADEKLDEVEDQLAERTEEAEEARKRSEALEKQLNELR
jgi:hypothetical protein